MPTPDSKQITEGQEAISFHAPFEVDESQIYFVRPPFDPCHTMRE
jgi:hypothetical protein